MTLSPQLLADLQAIAADVRASVEDDEVAFWDSIQAGTDALEMLDRLIAEAQQADAMEDAARLLAQRQTKRAQMFAARRDAARQAMVLLMDALGERKAVRPGATLTLKPGALSVDITDKAAVPTQLRKPGEPDKAAIRAQLEAGVDVPGARIVQGGPVLSVRIS